ncbi:MAG TPA: helix-turn-helix domain-containing protein [Candidatus Binatia bacterium]|nr:helix-turn-helix domain-containing protein [Candidatus Binatia bacterium]
MAHHLRITARERQALLEQYRQGANSRVRLRAHSLLLLTQGHWWALIAGVLFCSTRTIARWKRRVETEGISAILGPPFPPTARLGMWGSEVVAHWVLKYSPRDFGFLRSRWCWGVSVLLLGECHGLHVSAETVRRWLHREQLGWRRPISVNLRPCHEWLSALVAQECAS